jgi:V/A-type H+-transporting ATPase subunit D
VERVNATRSSLLERRNRLDLATRGRNLLEQKRDQLMEAFRDVADEVLAHRENLDAAAASARLALIDAEAAGTPEGVGLAAAAGRANVGLEMRTTSVMGVRIAEIAPTPVRRARFDRGYTAVSTTPHVDEAADRFEYEIEVLLEMATRELRLRRLVEEIATTTRRVNALELVVIPELQSQTRRIQSVLDEREREDRFRLKRVKERRGGQKA